MVSLGLLGCGVAERSLNGDGGVEGDSTSPDDVVDGTGSCSPWRVDAEVHAATANAEEVYAVIQPFGPKRMGQLIAVDYEKRSVTAIVDLRTDAPERSGLMLDEGMLYWSDSLDQGADVVRVDPTTGALETIAQQQVRPTAAVANSNSVYWGVHGGIMRYRKSDGSVDRVHNFEPYERVDWITVTDDTLLYTSNTFAYRVELDEGLPQGPETQIVQTTRPIGLHEQRLYYLLPSTLTASGKDELMSIRLVGGEPRLEAQEDYIGGPTLLADGDLMWFNVTHEGFSVVRQNPAGDQEVQTLAGPNGGSLSWTQSLDTLQIWIAGNTLTLLSPSDCN